MEEVDKFYDDEKTQARYEKRIKELVKEHKKLMKKAYSHVFHHEMIKQIARCELAIERLEKLIQNDRAMDDTPMKEKVKYEQHLRALWSQLQMDMKGQRGDAKNVTLNTSDNFKDFMTESLMEMYNTEKDEDEKD